MNNFLRVERTNPAVPGNGQPLCLRLPHLQFGGQTRLSVTKAGRLAPPALGWIVEWAYRLWAFSAGWDFRYSNRFNPLIKARALAVMISRSEPRPRAIRPFSLSRTVTSP